MERSQTKPVVWQYHLVWTPGPEHSTVQLWCASRSGTRALWDSWETTRFVQTPTVPDVLNELHAALLGTLERHTHLA